MTAVIFFTHIGYYRKQRSTRILGLQLVKLVLVSAAGRDLGSLRQQDLYQRFANPIGATRYRNHFVIEALLHSHPFYKPTLKKKKIS
jgi:hypothetical protein